MSKVEKVQSTEQNGESCRGLSSGLKLVTNCPKVRGDVHFKSGSSALWETNSLVHLKEVDDLDIKIKVLFIP